MRSKGSGCTNRSGENERHLPSELVLGKGGIAWFLIPSRRYTLIWSGLVCVCVCVLRLVGSKKRSLMLRYSIQQQPSSRTVKRIRAAVTPNRMDVCWTRESRAEAFCVSSLNRQSVSSPKPPKGARCQQPNDTTTSHGILVARETQRQALAEDACTICSFCRDTVANT